MGRKLEVFFIFVGLLLSLTAADAAAQGDEELAPEPVYSRKIPSVVWDANGSSYHHVWPVNFVTDLDFNILFPLFVRV